MKKILVGICFALTLGGVAQSDQVLLRNGNIIEGKIINYDINDSISILLSDSLKVSFSTKDMKGFKSGKELTFVKKKGFYNNTSIGVLFGETQDQFDIPLKLSVNTINGFQINKHFKIGAGIGVDYFTDAFYFPITLNSSYTLFDKFNSPFIRVYGGWAHPYVQKRAYQNWGLGSIDLEYQGGKTLGAELGVRSYVRKDVGFTISCGYRFQQLQIHQTPIYDWGEKETIQYNLNRVFISLGFLFH